ncbi:MAG: alpha/beta fold hydrolase [Coriobacteriia bacterium]|nr:alpha/beta fold hydrolase [Coriobacteriia bacterium]
MAASVEKTSFELNSADGASVVRGFVWKPQEPAELKGVVQLIHGMAEYIDRYDDFARFLAADGYVVCGHDHLGHGLSQPDQALRGHMPADGKETLLANAQNVQEKVAGDYPTLPVFVFGHSMGSFVARALLRRHGKNLAGVVVCGTGFVPVGTSKAGNALARTISRVQGDQTHSNLLHSLADGAYSKGVADARTPFDWLNTDPEKVDAYINDPDCGYMFTAGGYAVLTDLTAEVCDADLMALIPRYVPLLYVAGDQDPVGDYGKGVAAAAQLALAGGAKDVQVKIYSGMRHEILQEPNRMQVYQDVLSWINQIAKA